MKNLIIIVFSALSMFFILNNQVRALSVADFTPALDKKVAKMQTTEEKVKYLQSFSDSLNNPKFTKSKNAWLYKDIREYALNMLNVFQHELIAEQSNSKTSSTTFTNKSSNSSLPHIPDNVPNIDEKKVRETILSRHNNERSSLGLSPYSYNLDLEGSATTRANKLADSGKTSNLHLRNAGDGYYNYNSMLNRFSNLGIKFPKSAGGAASFSETIGYNTYKCSKSDCTDELINAIKKTWTGLIMKEKASNGSHYRAATMKHFTQIGAGIAIDKNHNRYYIVLHYGINF